MKPPLLERESRLRLDFNGSTLQNGIDIEPETRMSRSGVDGALAWPRAFDTTHWSVVTLACHGEYPERSMALEKLCRTYWPPLYASIRRQGYSDADAKDFTQEFFARLLERNDFDSISPDKGKFRTFLLTALSHFLSNRRDYDRAAKRGGGNPILSLDGLDLEHLRIAESPYASPDAAFDARWAVAVLEKALANLRDEMTSAGKARDFEEMKVFLSNEALGGEYDEPARRLDMMKQAFAVAVHRLRRRYRELVVEEVAQTVRGPLELDEELRHLFMTLSASAGWETAVAAPGGE
jgi:RNA polymerase sigma-70 factor (ECF subfamily)